MRAVLPYLLVLAVALVGCGTDEEASPREAVGAASPVEDRRESATEQSTGEQATAGNVFQTLPPGSPLPSEQECAARVRRVDWEPRPENRAENHTTPTGLNLPDYSADFLPAWQTGYKTRITGNFTGTTDEIIQWAACKWGLEVDVLRAQAVEESDWRMSEEGDLEPSSKGVCVAGDARDPCPTSFGILQVKWYFNPGSYPLVIESSAFHLDFAGAKLRGCFDGLKHIGEGYPPGDLWGCLGNWWSGGWGDEGARRYLDRVRAAYEEKPWREWLG